MYKVGERVRVLNRTDEHISLDYRCTACGNTFSVEIKVRA